MDAVPAGIPEPIWKATHPLVRELVLEQAQQIERHTHQLTALATRVA
jgi:hypothetical protein